VFGRIQSLTTKASQQASASLQFANAQVTTLAAQQPVQAPRPSLTGRHRKFRAAAAATPELVAERVIAGAAELAGSRGLCKLYA
jgi:hypothetical protein